MDAGRLNEVITIQRSVVLQNQYGANQTTWKDSIITRADVQFTDGSRLNENGDIFFRYTKIFTIRYYHQIQETDRIKWNNQYWRILSIEPDKGKQYKKIITELIND